MEPAGFPVNMGDGLQSVDLVRTLIGFYEYYG